MTTLISGAYATVEALAEHMSLNSADHDEALTVAINAASREIDNHCHQSFWTNSSAEARTYRPTHARTVRTEPFHQLTDLSVDTSDNGTFDTAWTSTDFQLEPANYNTNTPYAHRRIDAVASRTFPTSGWRRRIQATAVWGWSSVPSEVSDATLILASRLFQRKDSPSGILGGFTEFGPVRVGTRMDPDVQALLANYVIPVQS